MKEIIEKIDVCEPAVKYHLEWLVKDSGNELDPLELTDVIRYLLKKVNELEKGSVKRKNCATNLCKRPELPKTVKTK